MPNAYMGRMKNRAYNLATGIVTNAMHLHPLQTGSILDKLYAVRTGTVNFFIYKEDEQAICIDAGFGRHLILRELDRLGLHPSEVTHVFLTHSDFDHVDGLAVFEEAEIYLSSDEEPMITGRAARMLGFLYNSKIKRPYHLLRDNDVVAAGSINIRAISTPGHTAGSMSYLVNESILFAGDTFKLIDGQVFPKRRYINMNTEQQKESIRKLARLDTVQLACTAHNGYTKEFRHAMSNWRQAAA
jgi:hydroxyacylglutathione hydrolase